MSVLSKFMHALQTFLFPCVEDELGPLSAKHREFVTVCEMAQLDRHMGPYRGHWLGRKKCDRLSIAQGFVAKAVFNLPNTVALIERLKADTALRRLCGWERVDQMPSESTFSRAFGEFATGDFGQTIHEAMVMRHCGDKLAGHISRDSTAIVAREKAVKKEAKATKQTAKPKRKRGRPRKGEQREPKPPTRLELQPLRSLAENLAVGAGSPADLPDACDWGAKRNSQGKKESWKGYKFHIDTIDGDIPISAVLTSASLHDSQAAIPLAQMSAQRVSSLYDLMDAAYDAAPIAEFSRWLGHVPIIDSNARGGAKRPMDPAEKTRYNERSAGERFNSMLKDNYGGRSVRVRGPAKVGLHLLFGVISICAVQLCRLLE